MALIRRPAGPSPDSPPQALPTGTWASAAYELRMQIRRPAVWLVLLLVAAATIAGTHAPFQMARGDTTIAMMAGDWAFNLQVLLPAAFGCLLADRILREKRLRVDELFGSLPPSPGRLLLGKYLGTAAATAVPIGAVYVAGTLYLTALHGPAFLPAAFALVNLPGLLFVAAFALGCPAVMPVALFQFLFVAYWFWGNFLAPGFHIPTISHTILTPVGTYALGAFFHTGGATRLGPVAATTGWASVGLLLALTALALWGTALLLARQRRGPAIDRAAPSAPRPAAAPNTQRAGSPRWQIVRYELRILGPGVLLTPLLIVGVFAFLALLTTLAGGHGQIVPRVLTAGDRPVPGRRHRRGEPGRRRTRRRTAPGATARLSRNGPLPARHRDGVDLHPRVPADLRPGRNRRPADGRALRPQPTHLGRTDPLDVRRGGPLRPGHPQPRRERRRHHRPLAGGVHRPWPL